MCSHSKTTQGSRLSLSNSRSLCCWCKPHIKHRTYHIYIAVVYLRALQVAQKPNISEFNPIRWEDKAFGFSVCLPMPQYLPHVLLVGSTKTHTNCFICPLVCWIHGHTLYEANVSSSDTCEHITLRVRLYICILCPGIFARIHWSKSPESVVALTRKSTTKKKSTKTHFRASVLLCGVDLVCVFFFFCYFWFHSWQLPAAWQILLAHAYRNQTVDGNNTQHNTIVGGERYTTNFRKHHHRCGTKVTNTTEK